MKHIEADLQIQVVDYLKENNIFCLHIPNERNTGIVELQRLSRMGVKKGAPDLIIYNKGRWEWWELKTKTGKHSAEQKCFQTLASTFGVRYQTIRSLEEAVRLLEKKSKAEEE